MNSSGRSFNAQGKPFEEMPAYIDNKDRIFALVHLPMVSEEASADLRNMIAKRLTFDQALARENTRILRVQKSRLFRFKGQSGRPSRGSTRRRPIAFTPLRPSTSKPPGRAPRSSSPTPAPGRPISFGKRRAKS